MFGLFAGPIIGPATLVNPQTVQNTTFDPSGKTADCSWGTSGNVAGFDIVIEIALNSGGPYFSPGISPYNPNLLFARIDLSAHIGLTETVQDYNFRFRLRDGSNVDAVNSPVIRFPPYSTV